MSGATRKELALDIPQPRLPRMNLGDAGTLRRSRPAMGRSALIHVKGNWSARHYFHPARSVPFAMAGLMRGIWQSIASICDAAFRGLGGCEARGVGMPELVRVRRRGQ